MPVTVNCPTCQQLVEWTDESEWRPFCSERCQLIDLGAWADESYMIEGKSVMPENLEE
ncbi:MAG: DNA gyrase inhibitor YacG [Granulosicoccaceae bacterium]